MKWAVAPVVDIGTLLPKLFCDPAVEGLHCGFAVESTSYPSLVGNDENIIAKIVGKADRFLGSVDPPETIGCSDVIIIMVRHPVAIKKYSRSATLRRNCCLGDFKCFWNPDVEKKCI